MKLYVDDIRFVPDNSFALARTVTEAINFVALFGDKIKVISLDYDISHETIVNNFAQTFPCKETFKPVAWFIKSFYSSFQSPAFRPKVILHTANSVGAEEMADILQGDFHVTINLSKPASRLGNKQNEQKKPKEKKNKQKPKKTQTLYSKTLT